MLGEIVVGLQMWDPQPPPGALDDLGAADATIFSESGSTWSQELWGSRGLVLHRRSDRVRVAFGVAAFEPEDWQTDPLRWRRVERIRR